MDERTRKLRAAFAAMSREIERLEYPDQLKVLRDLLTVVNVVHAALRVAREEG